ncbi:MAG: HAD family hydrolase [Pseudomonadota bacterium]
MRIHHPDFARVRAISFDLDDTLWPVQPVLIAAETAVYARIQDRFSAVSDALDFEALRARRMAFFQAQPALHHDLTRLRRVFFEDLLSSFGYREGSESLLEEFLALRNAVTPYPGCDAFLDALAARYPLVACTNGNADVFRTPLAPYFSAAVRSEEAGAAKPDARIFRQTCEAVSVRAAELAHVGDNPVTDVIGSQQFGCHGVWYNPDRLDWAHPTAPPPHADVDSYDSLAALFPAS